MGKQLSIDLRFRLVSAVAGRLSRVNPNHVPATISATINDCITLGWVGGR